MADPSVITAATVAIGQTVAGYSYFLPRISDVRRASTDDTLMRGDVTIGQIGAGAIALSVGVMLAWMTGSPVPVYATLFIAAVIAVVYQYALSGERLFE